MKTIHLLSALSLILFSMIAKAQTTYYVKGSVVASGAGTSWASAYKTLQEALTTATAGYQIWVAAGTYYPDEGAGKTNNDQTATFSIYNGVAIYGGFSGNETLLSERNRSANPTILSGDIDQNDGNNFANTGANSYHVVVSGASLVILDGLIISGGNADGNVLDNDNVGGGIRQLSGSLMVSNCSFVGNQARSGGGGLFNASTAYTLINCSFSGNQALLGGGICNNGSSPTLINCSFSGNRSPTGGGIYNASSSNIGFKNCILWGNSSEIVNANSTPTYTNTLIKGMAVGGFNGTEDPLFVSQPDFNLAPTATGDLRLQACSPALERGNNADNTTTTDLDGNPRKVGTIDLGAYEYQGSTIPLIFYVKTDGDDTKDGLSWGNAFKTLQKALQRACSGYQIWVAAGTYKPGTNRTNAFVMKNGVAIYGGFPNSGNPTLENRDWVNHATILSGDINGDDVVSGSGSTLSITGNVENCYHVIYNFGNGLNATAILNGFIVKGGNANGSDNDGGAGMFNFSSSPTITHCTFSGNQAYAGGGMLNLNSSPAVSYCIFSANWADSFGGGITNGPSSQKITDCIFLGNKAGSKGGAMYNDSSPITISNCTFSGNAAPANGGGGMFNIRSASLTVKNCILWGNSSQIDNNSSTLTVSYSLVQGGYSGTGNLSTDPLFVNASNGNLRLQACSPAINAGDNTDISGTDLDNNSRIYNNGTVDLGAYEYQNAPPVAVTPIVGSTSPSTCGGTNGSITLSGLLANTAYSVTYTKGATNVPAADFTTNANGLLTIGTLSAGSYTNIMATYGSCVSNAANAMVSDPVPPTANIVTTNSPICAGANASFTVSGTNGATLTYTLTGLVGNQTLLLNGSNQTITANNATTDITLTLVSVQDDKSCRQNQSGSVTVMVNALPVVSTPQTELCTGLPLTLSPTSGGTWLSSNPSIASVTNSGLVTGLSAGVVNFTFTQTSTGCSATTANVLIKQSPSSGLTASKTDVCPNTQVTLDAHCSIPNATVSWNPGAPTVTPNAATLPYIYKASCVANGCVGNESSVEVRTHRILVDMKDLDVGTLPLPIVRSVKDNMAPTNLIEAPVFPRRWTFIANGCDASESAVFTLSGPVNFMAIDNTGMYAMFANEDNRFYSLDHPNYGNGGSFPNGTYTLQVELRSADGVGGPFPKNRVVAGSLLASRSLQFTLQTPSARAGINEDGWMAEGDPFVRVSPNPVVNTMRLHVSESGGAWVWIELLDVQGRSLLQRRFVASTNQHKEELEISHLSSGMYFLRVTTQDRKTTLKVVKVP